MKIVQLKSSRSCSPTTHLPKFKKVHLKKVRKIHFQKIRKEELK